MWHVGLASTASTEEKMCHASVLQYCKWCPPSAAVTLTTFLPSISEKFTHSLKKKTRYCRD